MCSTSSNKLRPLQGSTFGAELIPNVSARALVTDVERDPKPVLDAFYEAHGLMVIKAMHDSTIIPRYWFD